MAGNSAHRPNILQLSMRSHTFIDPYESWQQHTKREIDLRFGRTAHRIYAPDLVQGDIVPLKWGKAVTATMGDYPDGNDTIKPDLPIDEIAMPFNFAMGNCYPTGRNWSLRGLAQVIDVKRDKTKYLMWPAGSRHPWPAVGLSQIILAKSTQNKYDITKTLDILAFGRKAFDTIVNEKHPASMTRLGVFRELVHLAIGQASPDVVIDTQSMPVDPEFSPGGMTGTRI